MTLFGLRLVVTLTISALYIAVACCFASVVEVVATKLGSGVKLSSCLYFVAFWSPACLLMLWVTLSPGGSVEESNAAKELHEWRGKSDENFMNGVVD